MKKFAIVLAVIFIAVFSGCTVGSGTALMMQETNTASRMSAEYKKFSGYKKTTVKLSQDEEKEVSVSIVTEKGKIDLEIVHEDGEVAYEGNDLETTDFTVTLNKSGKYTVRVDTKKHVGSYDINW